MAASSAGGHSGLRFSPAVTFGEGEVVIWLPELLLVADGTDFAAAKAALLDEVRAYADQFRTSPALQGASNRRGHAALIQELAAADEDGRLEDALFAAPAGDGREAAAAVR